MELIIKTPDSAFLTLIEFNHEELKASLGLSLEKYQGLIYDEDSIKEAKTDRATLNKLKAAIDAERKNMRARCLAPYEGFEAKVRELQGMIDQPMLAIDSQVKKFEDGKKAEKKEAYHDFYKQEGADIMALVPFERIFDEKWLNASTSKKAVEDVIRNTVKRIQSDLATIDSFGGQMTLQCKSVYLRTLNLSEALAEKNRMEELQARIAAEEARKQAAVSVPDPEHVREVVTAPATEEPKEEARYSLSFQVVDATVPQLRALKAFLNDHCIKFKEIKS